MVVSVVLMAVALVYIQWPKSGDQRLPPADPAERATSGSESPTAEAAASTPAAAELPATAEEKSAEGVARGNELLEQGALQEAITAYLDALALMPGDEDIHYNLGMAYARARQYEAAERHYRLALESFEEYPEVHNNLGNLLANQGRLEEAEEHLRRAVELLPEYALAHNNLGTLLQRQGQRPEGLACFQEAVNLEPGYWEARFNLGQALLGDGQVEAAVAAFREVQRLQPDFLPAREIVARLEVHAPVGDPE